MFQISSLISERRKECEAEVVRVNALLESKQHEMQLLKVKLAEKEVEVRERKWVGPLQPLLYIQHKTECHGSDINFRLLVLGP